MNKKRGEDVYKVEARVVATDEEMQQVFDVRTTVFVHEQNVPMEEEIDEYEGSSTHFLLTDGGASVGAGRFRIIEGIGKVERICVLSSHRKGGSGKLIMQAIERFASEKGIPALKLHAQTHAEGFYKKLGYETVSDVFLEAGIPHVTMVKELAVKHEA